MPAACAPLVAALQAEHGALLEGEARWRVPVGCPRCRGTGYRGRLGIYELITVTEPLQQAIMQRAPASDMARLARAQGSRSLRDDGLMKAWRGDTSLDEVLRVAGLEGVADGAADAGDGS